MPPGYFNLSWNNFDYVKGASYGQPSGFRAGVVSTNNSAYNNTGAPAGISASAPFNFLSAYLTAAWDDNLLVEAQGYNGSALLYDNFYSVNATVPTLIAFNYLGVTSVKFITSGGAPHPGYEGSGMEFVIDNMSVVQVPVSVIPGPMPKPLPMSVMFSFGGNDGGHPASGLALGTDGNLYGVTEYGGANESGAVFRLGPMAGCPRWLLLPAQMERGREGGCGRGRRKFYGGRSQGGAHGQGTVFNVSSNGAFNALYSFGGTDGAQPKGGLAGRDGNFYGATARGGAFGEGTSLASPPMGILPRCTLSTGLMGPIPTER